MGIYRTNNPAEFDDVDGIIIDETAPAPNIQGVATGICILVGKFQRGPMELKEVGSIGELHEQYGKSNADGNIALKNKKFGRLRLIRVIASDAVVATKAFASSATDRITFSAKQGAGVYGNNIKVTIATGTNTGKKYTVQDTNSGAVLPTEVYDDVAITAVGTTFANSKLVTVVVNSTAAEPTNAAATSLALGSDGTVADSDYQDAIDLSEVEKAGNIIFLDEYNATRNGYLKTSMANVQDKMAILAGGEDDSVSTALSAAAAKRDTDGRLIYVYNWIETVIDGVLTYTSPASWLASVLSQISPHVDPAYAANIKFLAGATNIKNKLTRADYIQLKDGGVAAFEYDGDLGGFKLKSGVVTQISNSSKVMIFRRRMADYLTDSIGLFLKNYQNAPNTTQARTELRAAMQAFIQSQEDLGILPRNSDVKSGKAKIVDTESLNTDDSIAAGFLKILYKQRIHSSARYIVLQAEIGESVVVTEGE